MVTASAGTSIINPESTNSRAWIEAALEYQSVGAGSNWSDIGRTWPPIACHTQDRCVYSDLHSIVIGSARRRIHYSARKNAEWLL